MTDFTYITAILNTHNCENVVKLANRALESVINQDIEDVKWEFIWVNDGKPMEELVDLAEEWNEKFNDRGIGFTFFGTEESSGYQCKPKNTAIYHAKGEYIAFLDYDNEWTSHHLRVLYEAHLEGDVWPDFVYGRRKYVRDEGCDDKVTLPGGKEIDLNEGDTPLMEWTAENVTLLGKSPMMNFVDTSDFMIAKGALWRMSMATGCMWNEGLRRFADWELIARGAHYCGLRGKAVDEVVQVYHWTGNNLQLTRPAQEEPQKERVE